MTDMRFPKESRVRFLCLPMADELQQDLDGLHDVSDDQWILARLLCLAGERALQRRVPLIVVLDATNTWWLKKFADAPQPFLRMACDDIGSGIRNLLMFKAGEASGS